MHRVLETTRRSIEPKGHAFQGEEAVLRDNPYMIAALLRNGQVVKTGLYVQGGEASGALELVQNSVAIRYRMVGGLNTGVSLNQIEASAVILLRLTPTHKN